MRLSPGPSWTVLSEPPNTSPAPTPSSDPASDLADDEEDNLHTPPGKRKAIESPVSVQRPRKVARFDDDDQPEKSAQVSQSDERTNGAAFSSLTQPPKIAKISRSFLSQPTRASPVRPETAKDRASSGRSSSSLSDHISTIIQKQNARLKRVETARKTARKTTGSLRVSTSDLIRAVQKPSSGSEPSSAATRVRRVSVRKFPRGRPPPSKDVIELTDSSGSTRRRRVRDNPIVISSSDADTPPRQTQLSQTPNSRKTCPKRAPPPDAEVICISDSDNDNVPAPPPATVVLPIEEPSLPLPSPPPIVPESENEPMLDFELQAPEDSFYEPMEPESNFDEELARSELQRQTEELFSYIDLDPPEQDNVDQIASLIAQNGYNAAQDPAPRMPTDSTPPSSEQATETSLNDIVPVEITSQLNAADTPHLELSSPSNTSTVAPEVPSETYATAATITKPSITWKYTPPSTNPFFARALAFNAKALKKPLPLVTRISSEPTASASPAAPVAAPAAVGLSTTSVPLKPSVDEQVSGASAASSNPSPSFVRSPPHDDDRSVSPSPADKVPISTSDMLTPPPTALPSSVPLPVPPRVQRPVKLSLTELINKRREEHFRPFPFSDYIDLTDNVSSSSGGSQAPNASMSNPPESAQSPHMTSSNASSSPAPVSTSQPAPTVQTRTPSIQEIRDLMRQRPSSSKLSISSAASNPSTSSAASASSALVPNTSPPRSITSNSTSSSNQSGSKSSSRRKNRSMGMASIEMFISPISDASQPTPTKKATPQSMKRTSCNADVFRRIITPASEMPVRGHSLSPSEGRRTRRVVRPPSTQGSVADAGADDIAAWVEMPSPSAQLRDQHRTPPEPLQEFGVTSPISPFAIPVEEEAEVQTTTTGAESRHAHEDASPLDDVINDMVRSEGLQGVTESIGSLDLHEYRRSPEVEINVDQVGVSPLENICEVGYLEDVPVSAELMEHEALESLEMMADDVSAGSVEQSPVSVEELRDVDEEHGASDMRRTRTLAEPARARSVSMGVSGDSDQDCFAVQMQLEASDGEVRSWRIVYVQPDDIFADFSKTAFPVSRVCWFVGRCWSGRWR
ncbi:hypothetical protein DEU56DRAFT_503856 [Suillus clintonianus]|uniref:uncharacterized protein n=1 Tax=Suillus clintonianus TaxID=1904413 RepID=UPI001B874A99|nr:uncharacterized protein DEU56DRAFT_503856 [Suillus clintonianus]KAG2128684.1 hypothetical protein DEU56DRAFT_503856 [Suillus clintonianus]